MTTPIKSPDRKRGLEEAVVDQTAKRHAPYYTNMPTATARPHEEEDEEKAHNSIRLLITPKEGQTN
jgi:endonuclease IV